MATKGDKYEYVPIDLQKWAQEYMLMNNIRFKAELARRIKDNNGKPLHRSRITEMLKKELNKRVPLQMIVESLYGGNYLAMKAYAVNKDGEEILEIYQLKRTLNRAQAKKVSELRLIIASAITKKDMDCLNRMIKVGKNDPKVE